MKRNSSFAKIILAAIFFQSHFAFAENFSQQTNADVNSAAEFQPLVCKKVPSPYWNDDNGGERPMVDDPACVAENNNRAKLRNSAANVQAQTARSSTGDGTQLVAPKAPAYTCGSMEPFSSEFQACQSTYNAANKVYQRDLEVHNKAQTMAGDAQNANELKAIEDQKNKTATATLAEIKDKNEQGKKSYDKTAKITMALGIAATVAGTACASQCSAAGGGCCSMAPGFFATAAAMFLMNSKAKKQSGEHAASAQNACNSLNQLSSQASDCAPPSTNGSTTGTTTISYDPVTGKCLPEGAEECKQLPTKGAAAPAVRDALKTSGFATGKLPDDAFKVTDGAVKFKNGKTYKEGDFKDVNALIAAGVPAGMAKGVMDSLSQATGGMAALGGDSKAAKKEYKESYGTLGGADGATTVVDVNRGQSSDKKYTDDLGAAKGDDKKFGDDRAPSSEGLAKEFNGELIGVAGDDIFLMMNRRYKLKSEQDSFIAQDLK